MTQTHLIANWKLYLGTRRSATLAKNIAARFGGARYRRVAQVLCPSAPEIEEVAKALNGTRIRVGAQQVGLAARGAATGEVSIRDLKALGCRYVIVGHSERRALGETDAVIAKKLRLVASEGLTPILCVGEPAAIRHQGKAKHYVERQLRLALKGFRGSRLYVAYEPVWAISRGGKTRGACSPAQAEAMRHTISQAAKTLVSARTRTVLLYGGSVSGRNIGEYLRIGSFAGALVGFASTSISEYATMVRMIRGG